MKKKEPLMSFAGLLTKEEGDKVLEEIKKIRKKASSMMKNKKQNN